MAANGEVLRLFQSLTEVFLTRDGTSLGKMLKAQCLRIDGKTFAYPSDEGLVFKLPKADVAELETTGGGKRLLIGKRAMNEWVVVQVGDVALCHRLAEHAYRFVGKR